MSQPQSKAVIAGGLALAIVVAAIGNFIISVIAHAAGASSEFVPLQPPAFILFTVVGTAIGAVGWNLVRSKAGRPSAVLRVLVPVVLLLSWVPDPLVAGGMAGASAGGVVALMCMHVVVFAVVVPVFLRVFPFPDRAHSADSKRVSTA